MSAQPIPLGALIALLETRDATQEVRFDFGYMQPNDIDSYRGYYDHLALSYQERGATLTVETFLKQLRDANGQTFTGYKGGEYTMDDDTPVWVAKYGECPGTCVTGIVACEYMTVVETGYCENWDGAALSALEMMKRMREITR